MKKQLFSIWLLMGFAMSSCVKSNIDVPQQGSLSAKGAKGALKTDYVDQNSDGSGVNSATGYEELIKQTTSVVNPVTGVTTQTWDGHTYYANWYGIPLTIVIDASKITPKLGDPVYGTITPNTVGGISISGGANLKNGGSSTFIMTVIQWQLSNTFSSSSLSNFDQALAAYFSGQLANAPSAPGDSTVGSSVKTVYGKLINVNTGSGFALARIDWVAPPPPTLPYVANQSSATLTATTSTTGGVTTVTLVDNSTLPIYPARFAFNLTSTHLLHQTSGNYDIASSYTGISWSQLTPDRNPYIVGQNPPANCIQFGLTGTFAVTNAFGTYYLYLPIYITYNYSTSTAIISYDNSAYLAYLNSLN